MNDDFDKAFNTFHDRKLNHEKLLKERDDKWKKQREEFAANYKIMVLREMPRVCAELSQTIQGLFRNIKDAEVIVKESKINAVNCENNSLTVMYTFDALATTVRFNGKELSFVPNANLFLDKVQLHWATISIFLNNKELVDSTICVWGRKHEWWLFTSAVGKVLNKEGSNVNMETAKKLHTLNENELKKIFKSFLL